MKNTIFLALITLCFGCAIDDTLPKIDAGPKTTTGNAGSLGASGATGTPGAAGSGLATGGTGGSSGPGAGTGGASAGSGGMGGGGAGVGGMGTGGMGGAGGAGGDVDASVDAGGMDAAPEAGTCAGFALQFDGTTFATVSRMVQDDFTIEAWIKPAGASMTGTQFFNGNGLIYADVGGAADDFGTALLNNHFALGIGNPDTTIQSTTDVTTGQWFHVAATRSASTGMIQVYVNGTMEAGMTLANMRSLTAQSTLTLGGNTIDSRFYFGLMDEVRIWNIVRAAGDISATMHQQLNGNETGLVAYWRFDEPGAATLVDNSPSQASASLFGNPQWIPSAAPVCPKPKP